MMKKINWSFQHLDMSKYPEPVIDMAKDLIEDLINEVDLPMEDGWVRVTPEMLVLLMLQVADSAARIRK